MNAGDVAGLGAVLAVAAGLGGCPGHPDRCGELVDRWADQHRRDHGGEELAPAEQDRLLGDCRALSREQQSCALAAPPDHDDPDTLACVEVRDAKHRKKVAAARVSFAGRWPGTRFTDLDGEHACRLRRMRLDGPRIVAEVAVSAPGGELALAPAFELRDGAWQCVSPAGDDRDPCAELTVHCAGEPRSKYTFFRTTELTVEARVRGGRLAVAPAGATWPERVWGADELDRMVAPITAAAAGSAADRARATRDMVPELARRLGRFALRLRPDPARLAEAGDGRARFDGNGPGGILAALPIGFVDPPPLSIGEMPLGGRVALSGAGGFEVRIEGAAGRWTALEEHMLIELVDLRDHDGQPWLFGRLIGYRVVAPATREILYDSLAEGPPAPAEETP